jgi:TetR/AcrR family transcriptional regulator
MPLSSKEKVLKAAIRVFSKKGYDGASIREIAAAARLTKPMIYYHFKDKKGLYLYLLETHIGSLHEGLLAVLQEGQDHIAVLGRIIDLYDETFRSNPEMFYLIQRETTGEGRFVDILTKKHFSDMQVRMAQFFKTGIIHGAFRPSINPGLCSLSLIAILMFHFSQGQVVQQLSAAGAANISSRDAIHNHIMSLFTR